MNYKIKPEYIDNWGSEATLDTIITESDARAFAAEWDMPFEDLLEQLYEACEIKFTAAIWKRTEIDSDIDNRLFDTFEAAKTYITDRIFGAYYTNTEKAQVVGAYVTERRIEYDEDGEILDKSYDDENVIKQTVIYKAE